MWKLQFILFLSIIQTFFWCVNCTSLLSKLYLLFQTILDLLVVLRMEIFISEILRRVSFNPYLLLLMFFSGLQVEQIRYVYHYILHIDIVLFEGFLVFSLIVFRVYKNLKSNHHLLFLVIFNDLQTVKLEHNFRKRTKVVTYS